MTTTFKVGDRVQWTHVRKLRSGQIDMSRWVGRVTALSDDGTRVGVRRKGRNYVVPAVDLRREDEPSHLTDFVKGLGGDVE